MVIQMPVFGRYFLRNKQKPATSRETIGIQAKIRILENLYAPLQA